MPEELILTPEELASLDAGNLDAAVNSVMKRSNVRFSTVFNEVIRAYQAHIDQRRVESAVPEIRLQQPGELLPVRIVQFQQTDRVLLLLDANGQLWAGTRMHREVTGAVIAYDMAWEKINGPVA